MVIEEASRKKGTLGIIKPHYLVPDTNCFIDILSSIQRLADTKHFVITVPLTGMLVQLLLLCIHSAHIHVKVHDVLPYLFLNIKLLLN